MPGRESSSYSRCLRPLPYQCKKCFYRNGKINDIPCCAWSNRHIMNRKYNVGYGTDSCPKFKPKNKRICNECHLKYECITGYENTFD